MSDTQQQLKPPRCRFRRHQWVYGDLIHDYLETYQRMVCARCGIVNQRTVGSSTMREWQAQNEAARSQT